jgi:hypothetical protein
MQPRHQPQRDLFKDDHKTPDIPTSLRSSLVRLIESLLTEAMADSVDAARAANTETKGGSHEQDHT